MGKNSVVQPIFCFNITGRNFCQSSKLIGAVLSISDYFRYKGHTVGSPHDQIWSKLQFWSQKHHSLAPDWYFRQSKRFMLICVHIYADTNVVNPKYLLGQLFCSSKNLRSKDQRLRSWFDQIWAICNFDALTPLK